MTSLDDFFAKKDRKKSATKTNLLAADELYRTLKETTKNAQETEISEKMKLEVSPSSHVPLEFGVRFSDEAIAEEDVWCEFTEKHDQPFSNLKRNSKIVLSPTVGITREDMEIKSEHCQYQDTGGDGLSVGQCTEELGKSTCPWLKLEPEETSNTAQKMVESCKKKQYSANKSKNMGQNSVYVPPAFRGSQNNISVRPKKKITAVTSKQAKGQAPDLNNVEFFPSLCTSRISKRSK